MKTINIFLVAILACLSSCTDRKQSAANPYAELGDTVPAKEFEPNGNDTLTSDTVKAATQIDSIPAAKPKAKKDSASAQ